MLEGELFLANWETQILTVRVRDWLSESQTSTGAVLYVVFATCKEQRWIFSGKNSFLDSISQGCVIFSTISDPRWDQPISDISIFFGLWAANIWCLLHVCASSIPFPSSFFPLPFSLLSYSISFLAPTRLLACSNFLLDMTKKTKTLNHKDKKITQKRPALDWEDEE